MGRKKESHKTRSKIISERIKEISYDYIFSDEVMYEHSKTNDSERCCYIEDGWLMAFLMKYRYPDYNNIINIINDETYDRTTHNLLDKLWLEMFNDEKIKIIGNIFNNLGGFAKMSNCHSIFIEIIRNILKNAYIPGYIKNIILTNTYKKVEALWDGIGDWRV